MNNTQMGRLHMDLKTQKSTSKLDPECEDYTVDFKQHHAGKEKPGRARAHTHKRYANNKHIQAPGYAHKHVSSQIMVIESHQVPI